MRNLILHFLFLLIPFTTFELLADNQEILHTSDIQRIMKQILEHHLETKKLSNEVFNHALKIYLEQFDPFKMYLLESEVRPFIELSATESNAIVEEYKKGNFTIFNRMNDVIQQAILRSRKLRPSLENKAREELFQLNLKKEYQPNVPTNSSYPKTLDELKDRMFLHLDLYINAQRHHYGDSVVARRKDQTIRSYENSLRDVENQYLYVNDKDQPLPKDEQENLFTIHVLKALASSLDAHTSFYQAKEAYDIRVRLQKEFQGVGIFLKESKDGIFISRLLPGGPAEKSGLIQPNDILVEVDGKSVFDLPFNQVMEMLHDEKKPDATLVLKRKDLLTNQDKIFTVKLKRQEIIINTDRVDTKSVPFGDGIIGIIDLHSFYQGNGVSSEKDVRDAIQKLEAKGKLKGLILDLRDNSGGFLSQAVSVAGLFIKSGVIVISKYDNNDEKIYRDVDSSVSYDGPLVILVSKLTASAAEIVAEALQDYGVAIIVGDEHTYGKGTIQSQTVTDNSSASFFKVTIGKYYTVSGKTPQKNGVKSDILIPGPLNSKRIGEEYVDSVKPDSIAPLYKDPLEDLSTSEKKWYLKYYTPKLQQRLNNWTKMIPTLKKNSEYRIAHNKDYQFFLKGEPASDNNENDVDDEEIEWMKIDKKKQNFGQNDLQLEEAENVVKDMFFLQQLQSR